jgi:hypothetical protein
VSTVTASAAMTAVQKADACRAWFATVARKRRECPPGKEGVGHA